MVLEMKKKKEILILGKSLGGGGSEVAMIEFINHLDFEKFNVTLLLMDRDNEYKYKLKKNPVIKYIQYKNRIIRSLVSMYSLPAKVIKKLRLNVFFNIYDFALKNSFASIQKKYDIALDFYGYGSFSTAFIAKNVCAIKKGTWLHDSKMPWIKNVIKYLDNYDSFFCVSNSVKRSFSSKFSSLSGRARIFYNYVNDKEIVKKSKQKSDISFSKENLNIVTVGRLTEQKGYDIAIGAAKILQKENIPFKWYVVGDGKDKNKLQKKIKKLKLNNSFFLLGRRNNPYPLMKNCSLYVQPSRHEGFGLTVFEARILDKVVIASNIPEFEEQIVNGFDGVISKLNSKEIADNIIMLWNNKYLIEKLEKNLTFSRKNFGNTAEIQDMFNVGK